MTSANSTIVWPRSFRIVWRLIVCACLFHEGEVGASIRDAHHTAFDSADELDELGRPLESGFEPACKQSQCGDDEDSDDTQDDAVLGHRLTGFATLGSKTLRHRRLLSVDAD